MHGKKILLVDDDPMIRGPLREILSTAGFTVIEAKDGQECLKYAQHEVPDLILLDVHLTGMDGVATLQQLRSAEWGKDIKVAMLSSETAIDVVTDTVLLNVTTYLDKSTFAPPAILATVQKILA